MANSYGAVSVTTAATKLFTLKNQREGGIIQNNSSQTIYLGMDNKVTTVNGLPIAAGSYLLNSGYLHNWRGDVWAIVAATTADVRFWDWENQ